MMTIPKRKAFTLIELLIVIAIILILISIALPNFLEAQVRAKVTKIKGEFKGLETALESYAVDWKTYPIYLDSNKSWHFAAWIALRPLTTPNKYITSNTSFYDPFNGNDSVDDRSWDPAYYQSYRWGYYKMSGPIDSKLRIPTTGSPALTFGDGLGVVPGSNTACVWSFGPSHRNTLPEWAVSLWWQAKRKGQVNQRAEVALNKIYNPTNGTSSSGAIVRYFGEVFGLYEVKN